MTRYHLVLHRSFDLEQMEHDADADRGPRHVLAAVQRHLDARVHQPATAADVRWYDRVFGRAVGLPEQWAQARAVVGQLAPGDVVFAHDHSAFLIGLLGRLRRRGPRVCMPVTWPDGARMRILGRWLALKRVVDVFIVNTNTKADTLRHRLAVPAASIVVEPEQTDLRFFRPDPDAPRNAVPLVYAAGREGRDYATLGEAVHDLDVEVLVCAISASTTDPTTMTVPEPMPSNMRFEPLDWVPFRDAYQRADVVVVPLLDRLGSPGLTVIMEAMACKRPVIATRTAGYVEDLVDGDYVIGVPPGDASALRAAITAVLADPSAAAAMSERAYELMTRCHSPEHFVETIVTTMRELAVT